MNRRVRLLASIPTVLALLGAAVPVSAQAVVQRVEVQVVIEGPIPHETIRERLNATVQSVADRLLIGRPLDQGPTLAPGFGDAIADVVSRVATGYVVTSAAVEVASVSVVRVRLAPAGPVIAEVDLVPDLRAVHPRLHDLMAAMLGERVAPDVQALYAALPARALEWAAPILEVRAREMVEAALPGFTAAIQVRVVGDRARAGLTLQQRDTRIVRNIGVRFRSSSIPSMLLDQHGPPVVSMGEPLRGLPVAFAQAHRATLEGLIHAELSTYPPARQYHIVSRVTLDIGETTYITVVVESLLYRARVEAQLNVGAAAPGPALVGHLGRLLTPRMEASLELHLVPNTLSWDWRLGLQAAVTPSVALGAAYAVVAQDTTVWASVQIGLDTGVRGQWSLGTQTFEGAVTYRFNDVLSGELIGTSQGDWWMRLVTNL